MTSIFSSHFVATFLPLRPLFAQEETDANATSALGAAVGGVGGLLGLLVAVIMIVAMWKVFSKARQPGWAAIVPIYNWIVWCKIVGRPLWWVVLAFLCAPIVIIILSIDLAKSFGKGTGFAIGMIFLPFIFWPALAFGSATYQGPSASPTAPAAPATV